ncbi:MAG: hypothetical protein DWQ07_09330 [Chloroflexi bacterium]|nr:MAG: hypothetical protein DWQ07_09330 [Chloroflexota bacterium]MBL1193085.1 hypothetical protein [Chloroflexota bacterium]NOH10378.1 hypothetical protein [Chloroflexota bacterium]
MGVSSATHQAWLKEVTEPVRHSVLQALPDDPLVVGLGEQRINPFLADFLGDHTYRYQAYDYFPTAPEVIKADVNDLRPLIGVVQADILAVFRTTMFIEDKDKFFADISSIVKPGGFLFIDLHIGSAYLPVLGYQYADQRVSAAFLGGPRVYYYTTFYDERLVNEYPEDVNKFCAHARFWPLATHWSELRKSRGTYLRSVTQQRGLMLNNFEERIRAITQPQHLITLQDFDDHHFDIHCFAARYFYPVTNKFKLVGLVVAQRRVIA